MIDIINPEPKTGLSRMARVLDNYLSLLANLRGKQIIIKKPCGYGCGRLTGGFACAGCLDKHTDSNGGDNGEGE